MQICPSLTWTATHTAYRPSCQEDKLQHRSPVLTRRKDEWWWRYLISAGCLLSASCCFIKLSVRPRPAHSLTNVITSHNRDFLWACTQCWDSWPRLLCWPRLSLQHMNVFLRHQYIYNIQISPSGHQWYCSKEISRKFFPIDQHY